VSTEKADAIVIRQVDFSESSRIVTFFSREFGKLTAMAKGAKRLKGPFDAALDLLSTGRIVFIRKSAGTLNLLTEARLTTRFRPQGADLLRVYGGYYVADLLNGLTEDFDPHPDLFDQSARVLQSLCSADSTPSLSIVHFEVVLLREIGLLPNLDGCSVCGNAITFHGQFTHWASQGGLLCAGCRREEYSGKSVSAESVRFMRQLANPESTDPPPTPPTPPAQATLKQCHQLAVSAITSALGRRPRTLRYLEF
jgi:DNA repair protein RecO (recombination protein O)